MTSTCNLLYSFISLSLCCLKSTPPVAGLLAFTRHNETTHVYSGEMVNFSLCNLFGVAIGFEHFRLDRIVCATDCLLFGWRIDQGARPHPSPHDICSNYPNSLDNLDNYPNQVFEFTDTNMCTHLFGHLHLIISFSYLQTLAKTYMT